MKGLELKNYEFAVGQAEFETGIVLKKDGTYYKNTEDISEIYRIFDSLENAKSFAIMTVKDNPTIECFVSNCDGELVFVCDNKGERKQSSI